MDAIQHDSQYSWIRLAISLALSVVGSIGMWAVVVILPALQADLGVDRATATYPYIATMIGFAVGNLMLGRAVDRWGITPVLVAAGAAQGAGFALSAFAPSMAILTSLHLLVGLGAAACFGPLIADASQWFLRHRGAAVAVTASGNYLSGAIWPPFLVPIIEDVGWRGAHVVIALGVTAIIIPGAFALRRQIGSASLDRARDSAAAKAEKTGLSPGMLQGLLALAGVACCVAMSMPQVHIVALCIDRGFGAAAGAEMLSLMLLGGIVSRLISGAAADQLGGLQTLLIGSVLQGAALCFFLIDGGIASLYLISLGFGLAQGGIVPSYAIIVREYMPPREAGRRVGIVISATILGMAFGGWLSGWLYDLYGSYDLAIWNGIGWNLLNATIVLVILWRIGGHHPSRPRLA